MTPSIYTNYFADLSLPDSLAKIRAAGFRQVEVADTIPFRHAGPYERDCAALRAHADAVGVHMCQAHGYWGEYCDPSSPAWGERLARFQQEIAVAGLLGVKVIVAHPMYRAGIKKGAGITDGRTLLHTALDRNVRFFSELVPTLQRTGMRIAIENMPSQHEGFTTIDEIVELVDALGPTFGICLDTGHLNQAGGEFVRFIEKAGARLIATHIQDCLALPGYDLHLFPLFSSYGSWVNWTLVRDCLKHIDYRGPFSFETPGEGPTAGVPLWIREKKLRYMFEIISEFITQTAS